MYEIKNKLRKEDVIRFVKFQLPRFKENFPEYAGCRIYGGTGALVVKEPLEQQANKSGLFVLTQGKDGNAEIYRPKRLKSY